MRLPLIAPNELTAEQRALYEDMRAGIGESFRDFVSMRQDGALMGPWNPWLHEPSVGKRIWELTKALSSRSSLPDTPREVAILVVGSKFKAAYQIYAHVAAARCKGIPEAKLAALLAGQRPGDLTRDEAIAYDVATALLSGDALPEPIYSAAVRAFGEHGAAELCYLIGLYCLVSVTLNAFDIPVPERAGCASEAIAA
jgi:alkylhydroperoxidase family enzyme